MALAYGDGLEGKVLQEVSEEKAWQHVEWLTLQAPDRISGGGDDAKAAAYVKETLEEAGLTAQVYEPVFYNSDRGVGELRVISPETRVLPAEACLHIASTLPSGVEAELVYIGPGAISDYQGKDVRGKIVLLEVSYSPATPEKARIAAEQGALGMILMNWGTPDRDLIPMRALKAVWGNPTPETFKQIPQVTAVCTTRAAGEYLKELCRRGRVVVRLVAMTPRHWSRSSQPIGRLHGNEDKDQFIIVSGHLDCWAPGATDNATGMACMMEIARTLSRFQPYLRRSVEFAFWNGHEVAEAAGSTWYVDHFWDDIQRNAVAYLNIDSLGMVGATELIMHSSPELRGFHGPVEKRVVGYEAQWRKVDRFGDQSFFGIGVPTLTGRFNHTQEQIRAWNGATLGWWNHTPADTLDKVDRRLYQVDLRLWAAYVLELAISPVLPMRFTPVAAELKGRLTSIYDPHHDPLALGSILEGVEDLGRRAQDLDALADRLQQRYLAAGEAERKSLEASLRVLNTCLLRLSRDLTSTYRTVSGRYQQDSYGLSYLLDPIPALHNIRELNTLQGEPLYLLETHLRRQRNAIADGVLSATERIEGVLERLKGL